jgi:hypothetical protein
MYINNPPTLSKGDFSTCSFINAMYTYIKLVYCSCAHFLNLHILYKWFSHQTFHVTFYRVRSWTSTLSLRQNLESCILSLLSSRKLDIFLPAGPAAGMRTPLPGKYRTVTSQSSYRLKNQESDLFTGIVSRDLGWADADRLE